MLSFSFVTAALVCGMVTMLDGQTANPAGDPRMGTWSINLAKSQYPPGLAPRRQTLTWQPADNGGFKNTTDGIDSQGRATQTAMIGKVDGEDYPVQGGQIPVGAVRTRATRRLDDHTFEVVDKVNGRVTAVRIETYSADGKMMTNTSTRTDAQGQVVRIVAVYDRQ